MGPNLGILGQNDIWMLALWLGTKNNIKGKVMTSPSSPGRGESCEFVFARSSSMHQKCSNYSLTNLLFGLCTSVWVIDLLVTLPSPIPNLQHAPLPSKCYKPGGAFQLLFLPLFSPLDSQSSPSRSLKVRQVWVLKYLT